MDVDSLVERLRAGRRAAAAAREAASAEPAAPRLEPTATAAGTDAATTDARQQSRALFQRYFDNDDDAGTPPSPQPPIRTAAAGWPVPEERPRPPPAPAAPAGKAEAVQGTNVDAQISKLYVYGTTNLRKGTTLTMEVRWMCGPCLRCRTAGRPSSWGIWKTATCITLSRHPRAGRPLSIEV